MCKGLATGERIGRSGSVEGFSLPELLAVIAILGIMVVFGGPAVNEAYRAYKVRSAADSLVTDLRALRYNAVANRASRTMTLNNQSNAAPNQYTYVNAKGLTVTFNLEIGTNIETSSAASVTFNNYGATGASGNTTVSVSGMINDSRNDRYTITITPSGTVRSAYSTF